jgi:hypothetical protein
LCCIIMIFWPCFCFCTSTQLSSSSFCIFFHGDENNVHFHCCFVSKQQSS